MIEVADDAFLAEIFERPVFRVRGTVTHEERDAREHLKELAAANVFSYARVPTHDVETLSAFEDAGFNVVDTGVTLETVQLPPATKVQWGERFATALDQLHVERIAREGFELSRFHLDPHIERRLADEIKARWAGNFFSGQRGDYMVVAQQGGETTGFLQLLKAPDGCLTIDLVAVASAHRRKGIASAMIRFAAHHCADVVRLCVGTQAANRESLRVYQRMGFFVTATNYVVHCHGRRRRQPTL